jgi:hypothetical protein
MLYGDWVSIRRATSRDGKRFQRVLEPRGGALFSEGPVCNTRDPMLIDVNGTWHCYYTAHPEGRGAVYCRTSRDLARWSPSVRVAAGGEAGEGPYAAECPHVVFRGGFFYLFRTQRYAPDPETRVYRSADPLAFGIDDDRQLVGVLPVAAPEIVTHQGEDYLAALLTDLRGIRITRLRWRPQHG